MQRALKLAHFAGLVMFLGSILTFTLISALTETASLENLVFGREIISTGTRVLTLPGMWVLAVTGLWLGYRRYGVKRRLFHVKAALIGLIILNAYIFIVPAAASATELAAQSLARGELLPAYPDAYMREFFFGAVNVILAVIATVAGVWRPRETSAP